MRIVAPTWVPAGLQVTGIDAESDKDWGDSYKIRFTGEAGSEIVVNGAVSGIGDVFRGESRSQFTCPALGPGVIEHYPPNSEEGVEFRSHWLQREPEGPAYSVGGQGIPAEDMLRVAESLTFIG